MRLSDIAAAIGAELRNCQEDFEVKGISTLAAARDGEISFISDRKYAREAENSKASALIIPLGFEMQNRPVLVMREPWAGVLFILNTFYPEERRRWFSGIHPSAVVDPSVQLDASVIVGPCAVVGPRTRIGSGTVVGPNCVIGPECVIGSNCLFHSSVTISNDMHIGDRVILHPGTVIGGDGFKYEVIGGRLTKIPQVGRVVIDDDVEIGANSCVDRASFTETRIGRNTKIDNLVQIAHNCTIGANCIVVSQSGIAGSTQLGESVIVAAQVGVVDNLKIGNRARLFARSGVSSDIPEGASVYGTPAVTMREAAKANAIQKQLPAALADLAALKKRVEELERVVGTL